MPTRQEIDDLKANWCGDPCWDIYDTPGFQEHKEELEAYQKEKAAEWAKERLNRLTRKAEAIGCPGNIQLADYVEGLEGKIESLQERLDSLDRSVYRLHNPNP